MPEAFDAYYKWLGIPSEEQPPDRYRLLGIRMFEPDPDVISNAADQRMAHIRSFQAGGHSAAAPSAPASSAARSSARSDLPLLHAR